MTQIKDSKVLVTGAARGMGRLIAMEFATRGAKLALVDRDEAGLEELRQALVARGVRAEGFVCELSARANIARLRGEVLDRVGRVDILVNNAGVVAGGAYDEIEPRRDQMVMDVNMGAVHWMTRAFLADLKRGRDTHLVNMASAAGLVGMPGQAVYSATKWFVIGLSEAIRHELRDGGFEHVSVSIICPSLVSTGMFEGAAAPRLTPLLDPARVAEKVVDAVVREVVYVREPAMVKLMPLIRALLPISAVDLLMDQLGATALMKGFVGEGD